mgnify:FL=1
MDLVILAVGFGANDSNFLTQTIAAIDMVDELRTVIQMQSQNREGNQSVD